MLAIHLLCQKILWRVILKKAWLDDLGNIDPTAFLFDRAKDPDGLSVNIAGEVGLEEALQRFNRTFGADSLHCGRVRDLGLEVGQSEEDLASNPSHAVIVGLPSPDDDPLAAEDLATKLASLCRPVDRQRRSSK